MQRIYTPTPLIGNSTTINDAEVVHRLFGVMRMKPGDRCYLFDNVGNEFLSEVTSADKRGVSVGFVKRIVRETESTRKVHLHVALFKKQRFEWMLEKCTELGVDSFHPIHTEHTVVQDREDSHAHERWQRILISASEQSERTRIPTIHSTTDFTNAIRSAQGTVLVARERMDEDTVWPRLPDSGDISIFIGPEGGWSAAEISVFTESSTEARAIYSVSFGPRILRAETACIVASAYALQ